MSSFIDAYERRQQRREARLPKYKDAVFRLLRTARATEAVIEYDGEGDSGQIESVNLYSAANAPMPDKPLSGRAKQTLSALHLFKDTLHGALEAYAWELLWMHHDGFENNEGAYGTITINVVKETIEIEHNARIAEVFTSSKEV
jgi:hypothetical protein